MKSIRRFQSYSLEGLLHAEDLLVLDARLKICTLVRGSLFVEQVKLSTTDFDLMRALCETFPLGCSYEVLVSISNHISEDEATLRLLSAKRNEGGQYAFDSIMRPARNNISRLRDRISPLEIGIDSGSGGKYTFRVEKDSLMSRLHTKAQMIDEYTEVSPPEPRKLGRPKRVS